MTKFGEEYRKKELASYIDTLCLGITAIDWDDGIMILSDPRYINMRRKTIVGIEDLFLSDYLKYCENMREGELKRLRKIKDDGL